MILLMVWLYLTGLALLLGAEIDHEIEAAIDGRAAAEVAPGRRARPSA